jgi:Cu+-exporting ATPase
MLIPFILLGKYLETIAKSKTGEAVTSLMRLRDTTCLIVQYSNEGDIEIFDNETVMNIDLIQKNDYLKVKTMKL